jgi:hypothetical protein
MLEKFVYGLTMIVVYLQGRIGPEAMFGRRGSQPLICAGLLDPVVRLAHEVIWAELAYEQTDSLHFDI